MDFLINFDNNVSTQLPSKLIDYSLTGRPVLNIDHSADFEVLISFMDGDYKNKMKLDSPDNYDIRNVANKFLELHINT